jgi:hypothetical protein
MDELANIIPAAAKSTIILLHTLKTTGSSPLRYRYNHKIGWMMAEVSAIHPATVGKRSPSLVTGNLSRRCSCCLKVPGLLPVKSRGANIHFFLIGSSTS